ncbi:MAG: alpha-glucan family phosphorylase [Thermodesulfobacteriota bacterium]
MSKYTIIDQESAVADMVAKNKWGTFFGISQQTLDRVWNALSGPDGQSVAYITMEIGADIDVYNPVKKHLQELQITGSKNQVFDHFTKRFLHGPEKIPNYGGGLGILAGDTLKSLAEMKMPVVAVSLLYRKGYFSQQVDASIGQISTATDWTPESTSTLYLIRDPENPDIPLEIEVPFFDNKNNVSYTYAQVWLKLEIGHNLDYFVPEILLDYSIPSSPKWVQRAARHLYESRSNDDKIIQRRLLGAGVIPALRALGFTSKLIHLNEQHGVVVVLHLIAEVLEEKFGEEYQQLVEDEDIIAAADQVAQQVVYTIHTPVKAGHDRFEKTLFSEFGHNFCHRVLHLLAQDDESHTMFNFTSFAMRVNRATNSVSRLHKEVTQMQFPQFADKITAVTNGVHHLTWISDNRAKLYDRFPELKNWQNDPLVFARASELIDQKKFRSYFTKAWQQDTKVLINYINVMLNRHRTMMHETWIDPPNFLSLCDFEDRTLATDVLNIGFARRFSTYKRANLIFDDLERLSGIINEADKPINFIFAGKAHPADEPGQEVIRDILSIQEELYRKTDGLAKLVFITGYDMAIAKMMVAGVHAWLNSPKRPLEASGTSGMKAAINGVPNISTMDGWWVEGYHGGKTGWKFGIETDVKQACLSEDKGQLFYQEDADAFYKLLPEILNMFYDKEEGFEQYLDRCINNIALNIPIFNTHRMGAEYAARYGLKQLPKGTERHQERLREAYSSDDF